MAEPVLHTPPAPAPAVRIPGQWSVNRLAIFLSLGNAEEYLVSSESHQDSCVFSYKILDAIPFTVPTTPENPGGSLEFYHCRLPGLGNPFMAVDGRPNSAGFVMFEG